jgi:hypothetical protein
MNRLKSLWKTLGVASAGEGPIFVETEHNFTSRAQQVLALARGEADRFHHKSNSASTAQRQALRLFPAISRNAR